MKYASSIIPLVILVAVIGALGIGLTNDPRSIPSTLIDQPLPVFDLEPISKDIDGLASHELQGHVSMVNIFASWCPPCRIEHPTWMQLSRSDAVPIYGVDWKDKPEDGAKWLSDFGNPYSKVGSDYNGRLGLDLGITGAPETFVIDKTGRIRYKYVGPITLDVWRNEIKPLVDQLEGEE